MSKTKTSTTESKVITKDQISAGGVAFRRTRR